MNEAHQPAARTEIAAVDEGVILALTAIRLVTELNMRLGLDPDGSHTPTRALSVLGEAQQLEPTLRIWEGVERDKLAPALARSHATLHRVRPLMSRLARPMGED